MDIYQKLAKHLDNLPGGFPSTESGVEIRILKRLFTPENAALALYLTLIPEEPRVIARRAGMDKEIVRRQLEEMVQKGLIYAIYPEKGQPKYQASHYACGIWEFQVNRLTPEFVKDMEEYWPTFFDLDDWQKTPQFRTIPVDQSINVEHHVMSYEQAAEIVRKHEIFSVNPCICRQEQGLKGNTCKRPMETCLMFGNVAEFYLHRGTGRRISREEALDILHQANKNGLVIQPSNSKDVSFLCCCCSCCCSVLKNLKRHPRPASIVLTPFVAQLDVDTCTGCGTCIDRCQMEAIKEYDSRVSIDADRCIGCGLCVTECAVQAISLSRKPESAQKKVPKDMNQTYINLAKGRGKLTTTGMVGMLVKSKVDRLLAPGK